MPHGSPHQTRRRFLGSVGAGIAALGGLRSAIGTVRGAEPVRPAEYRWDLQPERDEERRRELSEYVDGVGPLIEDHPAFAYGTERAGDDHGVDFAALDLFRERNYERYAEEWQMDRIVEAFDDGAFETAKTEEFYPAREDAPRSWDAEAWRNADGFGESLDYAHSLLVSIDRNLVDYRFGAFTAMLREAYRRYHPTYEPLAWTFRMDTDIFATRRAQGWIGLVYSPTADELRAFVLQPNHNLSTDGSWELHPPIENWPVTASTDNESDELYDPADLSHPLLFHTEGWSRGWGFTTAKTRATEMVSHIATDPVRSHYDREGRVEITTGLLTQLTRTLRSYNDNDAEFDHLRQLANVMELARERGGHYVVDLPSGNADYDGVFDGEFAIYEVGYDYVLDLVARDGDREFDGFGETYGLGAGAGAAETRQGPAGRREGW